HFVEGRSGIGHPWDRASQKRTEYRACRSCEWTTCYAEGMRFSCIALLAAACGGSGNSVHGEEFRTVDAMGAQRTSSTNTFLRVDLVDQPNLCATVSQAWTRKNAHRLAFYLQDVITTPSVSYSAPSAPGTYTVGRAAGGQVYPHSASLDV